MANERYSENLVLKEMGVDLGENDFGFVFPQGEADNFDKIEKCLKEMGGKPALCSLDDYATVGTGRAKPEYIVTFNKDKNTIIYDTIILSKIKLKKGDEFCKYDIENTAVIYCSKKI